MKVVLTRSTRVIVALIALVALVACGRAGLEYIPNGSTYTLKQAEEMASSVALLGVDSISAEEALKLRQERLSELRAEGTGPSRLADTLTRDFPSDTSSVPIRVESATVDGRSVWLVVEAWGDKDGSLTRRRLWIFDSTSFVVVWASSFN